MNAGFPSVVQQPGHGFFVGVSCVRVEIVENFPGIRHRRFVAPCNTMDAVEPRDVLSDHVRLRARLADLDLQDVDAGIQDAFQFVHWHRVAYGGGHAQMGLAAREKGPERTRYEIVERGDPVTLRVEHPRGVVQGYQGDERKRKAQPGVAGDGLAVVVHQRDEFRQQGGRVREFAVYRPLKREFQKRGHEDIAADFGMIRKHVGVGPEHGRAAHAHGFGTVFVSKAHNQVPLFVEGRALEREGPGEGLSLQFQICVDDSHARLTPSG